MLTTFNLFYQQKKILLQMIMKYKNNDSEVTIKVKIHPKLVYLWEKVHKV